MSDLLKTYDPRNAAGLTDEQIAGLQNLTNEEIKQLAQAYPNGQFTSGYLLIIDSKKPINKQLPTLSTFQNLYNLRVRGGQKDYVAFNFKVNHRPIKIQATSKGPRRVEVRDLSDVELMELPGFKTTNTVIKPETVEVVKVKRGRPKKIQ